MCWVAVVEIVVISIYALLPGWTPAGVPGNERSHRSVRELRPHRHRRHVARAVDRVARVGEELVHRPDQAGRRDRRAVGGCLLATRTRRRSHRRNVSTSSTGVLSRRVRSHRRGAPRRSPARHRRRRGDDRGDGARGPDGAGVWAQGRVALGHRRLRIIDLCEAGGQPMVDADLGLTIVFNGCIYNHQELRPS